MRNATELPNNPEDVARHYERAGFDHLSDAQVFELAARVIAVPREAPANSFVLHAPLELMARALLLPLVPAADRRSVRERMLWVAAKYQSESQPVHPPVAREFTTFEIARRALLEAVADRALDAADRVAEWYVANAPVDEALRLAGPTLDMLAAAGHAPIAFFLLSRVATTNRSALALLRPLIRELARAPQLRFTWVNAAEFPGGSESELSAALARTPRLGLPGNDFIFPLVHQVDANGVAQDVIGQAMPRDVTGAARAALRVATESMLQDDPAFAPYGWTHCLTLPQAIVELFPWLSDPQRAAAIAATYVVAFRSGESHVDVDLRWVPEHVSASPIESLTMSPAVAAAAWYHAAEAERSAALPTLIARAASHEDAHFAKYTLACLVAAARDPDARHMYVAAAASLAAWWSTIGLDHGGFDDND
jgi:hypothetical protein